MPITIQQSNRRTIVAGVNDLATTHPDIAALWHPTKNLAVTPQQITKGSKTKRWWICSAGHEDFALPFNVITKKGSCSYCSGNKLLVGVNDFATLFPEVAKEWHPTLNGSIKPSDIFAGARKKYWWKCSTCEQSWEAPPQNRSRGRGCPVCAGQKIVVGINDLATVLPTVAALWHPHLNADLLPTQVTAGSPQMVWWKCGDNHEWQTRIIGMRSSFRKGQIGCAICYRNNLASGSKSLAEMFPEIAAEWDYEKNSTTPDKIAQFSNKAAWWKCSTNDIHSWEAVISNRTRFGSNCAICWQSGSASQAEEEVAVFLESLGLVIERKVITLLDNRKELDIYIPEHNAAVEYNGLHWHSEKYRSKEYHFEKYQECKDKGIELLQIWEDDWLDRKELVQFRLSSYFGKTKPVPGMSADDVISKEIDADIASDFLNGAHLQGATDASRYFGLLDTAENVVAVLAMATTEKEREYAISRYAAKSIAPNGFSLLLENAIETLSPIRIFSVSDNTMPDNGMLTNSGFKVHRLIEADYMYEKDKKRIDKTQFHHMKIHSNPNMVYFEGLNEHQLAKKNGFIRIWDAGKTQWVLDV